MKNLIQIVSLFPLFVPHSSSEVYLRCFSNLKRRISLRYLRNGRRIFLMKILGWIIGIVVLCSLGISIGGLLWELGVIPPWLISIFLLPAALFLDYWTKGEYLSNIKRYSTSIGILCMTLAGYLAMEFLAIHVIFVYALGLPFILFPELLIHSIFRLSESTKKPGY